MQTRKASFNDCYAFGRIAESQIARWLIHSQGYIILPTYEIEIPSGKGPRLFTSLGELVSPDILAMRYEVRKLILKWIESKHKTRFSWHYRSKNFQTGIDLRHYLDYIEVQRLSKIDVSILFLHISSEPSPSDIQHGSPSACPTGLFGRPLRYLMEHEHHRDSYDKFGREYPMVYWNASDLEKMATLDEVKALPISLWKGTA